METVPETKDSDGMNEAPGDTGPAGTAIIDSPEENERAKVATTREEAQDIDGGPAGAIDEEEEDPEERGERLKREREDKIKAAKERYLTRKKIKG